MTVSIGFQIHFKIDLSYGFDLLNYFNKFVEQASAKDLELPSGFKGFFLQKENFDLYRK